jgi:hypothetical protein
MNDSEATLVEISKDNDSSRQPVDKYQSYLMGRLITYGTAFGRVPISRLWLISSQSPATLLKRITV